MHHSSASGSTAKPGAVRFLAMCREEPFRIFFPLGLASGVIGLALWPLFLWGMLPIYPGLMHARVMIEGFMAAFIIGFLGTAGPRLLTARHFGDAELRVLIALHLGTIAAHLAARPALGDALFFVQLATLVGVLGRRFVARVDLPPPNFVLVACGLLSGAAGAAIVALPSILGDWPRLYYFGALALSQGFVLLPVLGVGAFLFPRFLGVPFGPELDELHVLTPRRKRKAILSGCVGAAIFASFAVESAGFLRTSGALRFIAAFAYAATQMPSVLKFGRGPFLGQCIRAAMWLMMLGLLWPVFLPLYRVTGLHLVFIGGFMLVVFTVATRVMLGHSGQLHLCKKPLPFFITTAALLLIGLAARVGADFMPTVTGRNRHLIWAAVLCIAAALVWGIRLVPCVVIPDSDK
jgi:uncharacterized protein involved in response to NO